MRKYIILIFCVCLTIVHCAKKEQMPMNIRIMTYNIRLNVASDSLNAWPHRKDKVASMIRFHKADIVGVQEALFEQVQDLAERLPDLAWLGTGRDDGARAGEFMAIFYKKERFKVLRDSTFWLSENPKIPGLGWDAACNRVVTWAQFEDRQTGKKFYHFNTHFDHRGEIARQESAKLLLKKITQIAGKEPVVVTGDFNSTPDSLPYRLLTRNLTGFVNSKLIDTKQISHLPHHGSDGTFNGFKLSSLEKTNQPIDYIFIKNGIKVCSHGTLSDTFNGFFSSDHHPVLAELTIQ